jgi:hypothetical protein
VAICYSIKDAKEIAEALAKKHPDIVVRILVEGTDAEKEDLKRQMAKGHALIATELASRGIDLDPDKEVCSI